MLSQLKLTIWFIARVIDLDYYKRNRVIKKRCGEYRILPRFLFLFFKKGKTITIVFKIVTLVSTVSILCVFKQSNLKKDSGSWRALLKGPRLPGPAVQNWLSSAHWAFFFFLISTVSLISFFICRHTKNENNHPSFNINDRFAFSNKMNLRFRFIFILGNVLLITEDNDKSSSRLVENKTSSARLLRWTFVFSSVA